MSPLEAICLFILLFSLLSGIALSINFRNNKKIVVRICTITIAICFLTSILIIFNKEETRKQTIQDMIHSRNGVILSANKIEGNYQTPFGIEIEAYNSVYEIQYRIGNKFYTAWYRSVDLVTNMEDSLTGKGKFYKEKWIFVE
jgi:hypothetical protein